MLWPQLMRASSHANSMASLALQGLPLRTSHGARAGAKISQQEQGGEGGGGKTGESDGIFDAALSISAVQWLLFRPDSQAALQRFFSQLYR